MALTREQLARQVAEKAGMPPAEIRDLLNAVFEEIGLALARGENVKLTGFATFFVKEKVARIGRNPKTMEDAPISARKTISFKPSSHFVEKVDTAHKLRKKK